MASINGIFYLIIGLFVAITSFVIDHGNEDHKMKAFFYLGLFLIAVGVSKLIIKYLVQKSVPQEKHPDMQGLGKQAQTHPNSQHHTPDKLQKTSNNQHNPQDEAYIQEKIRQKVSPPHGFIGQCAKCGTPMRRINMFCHRCGSKVR